MGIHWDEYLPCTAEYTFSSPAFLVSEDRVLGRPVGLVWASVDLGSDSASNIGEAQGPEKYFLHSGSLHLKNVSCLPPLPTLLPHFVAQTM